MGKYLVFSDSHGSSEMMFSIIREHQTEISGIFFLGDIGGDEDLLRNLTGLPTHIVRGNCDWSSQAPDELCFRIGKHKVAITHGHRYSVNRGVDVLKYWAMEKEADIVMYGHTHVPFLERGYNLTVLNPGSISRPRQSDFTKTYAMIDIDDDKDVDVKFYRINGDIYRY
ncbi:MAG: metallophosphoesterase [Eubacterium sp.]|nr:metallophosphoesterase [Eubacterium sp.]